jgi:hypothetical protein
MQPTCPCAATLPVTTPSLIAGRGQPDLPSQGGCFHLPLPFCSSLLLPNSASYSNQWRNCRMHACHGDTPAVPPSSPADSSPFAILESKMTRPTCR